MDVEFVTVEFSELEVHPSPPYAVLLHIAEGRLSTRHSKILNTCSKPVHMGGVRELKPLPLPMFLILDAHPPFAKIRKTLFLDVFSVYGPDLKVLFEHGTYLETVEGHWSYKHMVHGTIGAGS